MDKVESCLQVRLHCGDSGFGLLGLKRSNLEELEKTKNKEKETSQDPKKKDKKEFVKKIEGKVREDFSEKGLTWSLTKKGIQKKKKVFSSALGATGFGWLPSLWLLLLVLCCNVRGVRACADVPFLTPLLGHTPVSWFALIFGLDGPPGATVAAVPWGWLAVALASLALHFVLHFGTWQKRRKRVIRCRLCGKRRYRQRRGWFSRNFRFVSSPMVIPQKGLNSVLRGGAAGSRRTKRKREEKEADDASGLLRELQQIVSRFQGAPQVSPNDTDSMLVSTIHRIIKRSERAPGTLQRLSSVVASAQANRRFDKRGKSTHGNSGPPNLGNPDQQRGKGFPGKGNGSVSNPPRKVLWADLHDDNDNSDSPWVQVVRKGLNRDKGSPPKGSGKFSTGNKGSGDRAKSFGKGFPVDRLKGSGKGLSGKGKGGKNNGDVKPGEFALHLAAWPPASIVGIGTVVKALEAGRIPDGKVTLANDVKTVENLRRLAMLHELEGEFAVVLNPAGESGSVPDDADRHKIPMTRSGSVCLQDVWVWPLVKTLPSLPTPVIKKAENVVQPDSLTVYKVHLPKALATAQQWSAATGNPIFFPVPMLMPLYTVPMDGGSLRITLTPRRPLCLKGLFVARPLRQLRWLVLVVLREFF